MVLSDKKAILQVIGCLFQKPRILDETKKYNLSTTDFPEQFHKIIFAALNNLHHQGIEDIDYILIDSFLSGYDVQYKIFNDNNGIEYIQKSIELSKIQNFDYYYNRVKKFSLLREYEEEGVDVSEIYDINLINPVQQEKMQEQFDGYTIQDIIKHFEKKQQKIRDKFLVNIDAHGQHIGEGLEELKKELGEEPIMGAPLFSGILNKIFRGALLESILMRSAPSNLGKTRVSLADACNLAIDEIYDTNLNKWVKNGVKEKALFISTEMKIKKIQTPLLAFVSGVSESKIKDSEYTKEEEDRVDYAIQVLKRSNLWVEYLPDFNINDIENLIKKYILEKDVKYIFFDYVHVSMSLMQEIANQSKGMKLREDNILFMFVDRLKQICTNLGVYISTSSQVNGEWKTVKDADSTVLRGAKNMADRIDEGIVALRPTAADLKALDPILKEGFYKVPNMVYHIYKNRESEYVNVKLWLYFDKGTCRTYDLFLTDNDYNIIPIEALNIITTENDTYEETEQDIENKQYVKELLNNNSRSSQLDF